MKATIKQKITLPDPPELPKGYKYEERGMGWKSDRPAAYITAFLDRGEWDEVDLAPFFPLGDPNLFYLEIVKDPSRETSFTLCDYHRGFFSDEWVFSGFKVSKEFVIDAFIMLDNYRFISSIKCKDVEFNLDQLSEMIDIQNKEK